MNYDGIQKTLQDMVMATLQVNGVLRPNKSFGTFLRMAGVGRASVWIEEAGEAVEVGCPSHGDFNPGDYVLIENINNNPQDRFIVSTIRSIALEGLVDFSKMAQEPVRLQRNPLTRVVEKVFYGEGEYPENRQWTQELHRDVEGLVYAVTSIYGGQLTITRYIIKDADGLVVFYK